MVDRRIEETMGQWARRSRLHLLRAGEDLAQRARALERMNDSTPFAVRIVPLAELEIAEGDAERLEAGETVLVRRGEERMIYAVLDDDEAMALGPLQRPMHPPGERRSRQGRPPRLPRGLFAPWGVPQQGTYVLLGVLLAILVVIGAAVYLLLRPFERRILALADVARRFGEGRLDSRAPAGQSDAIGVLAGAFNGMAGRIEGFIERQKELLRAVSHEFRTPLARLFFLVDDAEGAGTPEEKNQLLERIEGSLQELNDLVEELLAFTRLEEDPGQPARESIDVAAVLADMRGVVADLRGDLKFEIECEELEVVAVPHLFRRAVLNLVTNAVRHARERIEIACSCERDRVHLHVDDDGPGIPEAARDQVFEPFSRLDESRTADSGGAGLGLAIVQRIMSLHGGRVSVDESRLGGARFTLSFPRPPLD